MSKRLFIWIGLIILIGVISAAGWSVYVTLNRPATEAPPPPVRGKIPQMPEKTTSTTIQPDSVPPVQEQAPTGAAKEDTPAADTQATPAPQPQIVNPAPTDQPAEQTLTTPPEEPTPEPAKKAAVETAADQSESQDSETLPAPEPPAKPVETPVQKETPESQTAAPEPEKQAEQPATSDPTPEQQPIPQEQASAPSTTEPEPEAKPAPKPGVPLDAKYTIQVGAFRTKTYAENMLAVLSGKGYEAYIFEDTDAKARPWYAVRFGHFPTHQAAQWALSAYEEKEQKKAMIARSGVR